MLVSFLLILCSGVITVDFLYFLPFFNVSFIDFKQVNVCWDIKVGYEQIQNEKQFGSIIENAIKTNQIEQHSVHPPPLHLLLGGLKLLPNFQKGAWTGPQL